MAGRNGPEWSNFAGREERGLDVDGTPVVVRVRVEDPPASTTPDRAAREALARRAPGWSFDPMAAAAMTFVEVKNRPEDPAKVRRRLERQLAEIEAAKAAASVTMDEAALRRQLAALERSS